MKKMMTVLAISALSLGAASTAFAAENFTPANEVATFEGPVRVKQTIELNCDMFVEVTTNGSATDAAVTDADFTGGLCGAVTPSAFPWNVDIQTPGVGSTGTATKLLVNGVYATTLFSSCGPSNVSVDWHQTPQQIEFDGTPFSGGCEIEGLLDRTSANTVTIWRS